jgi:hypothetical protein
MGSFKKAADTTTVDGKYLRKVIVYLESEEDFQIFKERWFYDKGEMLEFRSSDTGLGGGCAQVIRNVDSDRQNGIVAFGIVDRDTVMKENKWAVFWETDDQQYKNSMPFGQYIRPLCRWEIENYLLEPNALENIRSDYSKSTTRSNRPVKEMIEQLIGHCNTLIPVTAVNIIRHERGESSLPMGFGMDCHTKEEMERAAEKWIGNNSITDYEDYVKRVESFGKNNPPDSEQYLSRLNRIIDGKRILFRIQHHYSLKDCRFDLARRIKEKNKIEAEITELISEFKKYAPDGITP